MSKTDINHANKTSSHLFMLLATHQAAASLGLHLHTISRDVLSLCAPPPSMIPRTPSRYAEVIT